MPQVAYDFAVEGAHGAYAGRWLDMSGKSDTDIVGIALDGVTVDNLGETVASIPDTDNGRYDGDTVYDRAVGPLQFIPDTWARWERDGDGDGVMDPHDIVNPGKMFEGLMRFGIPMPGIGMKMGMGMMAVGKKMLTKDKALETKVKEKAKEEG